MFVSLPQLKEKWASVGTSRPPATRSLEVHLLPAPRSQGPLPNRGNLLRGDSPADGEKNEI